MLRAMGKWISERDVSDGARVRLFCLPHAGSGSAGFYRWRRWLPAEVDLCPIFLPGRELRLSEPLVSSASRLADGIAEAIAPLLDRPYAIFGHSMGALLAFELARKVKQEPSALYLSGRIAAHLPPPHVGLHRLDDEALVRALAARYGGAAQTLLEEDDLREVFLPIVRADLAVVETYRYRQGRPLGCPITVFAGDGDRSVSEAGLAGWRVETTGEFAVRYLPGDHFYWRGEGGVPLVEEISRSVTTTATAS
jgi:medium-chain acyl-[acyl-carrier-protein] hydrolase